MNQFRTILRQRAGLVLALLLVVLAMKSVVPSGFMLSTGSERVLTVTICADASGEARKMHIALANKGDDQGEPSSVGDKGQHCSFAGHGQAMLGGTDPVLITGAIAFILLVGLGPLRPALPREIAFLRPQLRGPPAHL